MNLTALKALILNHNHIKLLDNLQNLRSLSTLVVSHNNLEELSGIGTLTALEKLSAAHDKIGLRANLGSGSHVEDLGRESFDPKDVFRKKLKEGIKRRLENKAGREERKREREEDGDSSWWLKLQVLKNKKVPKRNRTDVMGRKTIEQRRLRGNEAV
ncbi:hypothetical protein BJ742DRAFT_851224 [Cladochytrium replicatum]|nr:hypothetical protein BJ742DRAFT_851224 [Cladochytrium replicatum]